MHVIMLTNAVAPDKAGGLERYVRDLSEHLLDRGVHVTVVAKAVRPPNTKDTSRNGLQVIRYPVPSKSDPLFAAKYPQAIARGVRAAIRSVGSTEDQTLIHGHFPVPMIPLMARRTRFIYTFHAPVYRELLDERQSSCRLPGAIEPLAVNSLRSLERMIVRRAWRVLTLSGFVRDEVAKLDPAVSRSVTIVPGGVDLRRFTRRPNSGLPRPLNARGPVFLTARRLVARTGVEQLIDAFVLVTRTHPNAELVIVGEGPRGEAIRKRIDHYSLGNRVHMIGRVSDQELVQWYQSVDVAVTPTQELEGFGLSTAEAMACGAVPVVTPVGANREVVAGLPDALISKSATAQDIAGALSWLLDDKKLMHDLRGAVVARHAQKFGWDQVVDKHLALYNEMINTGCGPKSSEQR